MKAYAAWSLKVLALAALLVGVGTMARAEDKANATGTWKWSRKSQDGQEVEITATLKQEGEKLTGKIANPMGELEISDGKVKDGALSFKIDFNGNEVKFTGKVMGDEIKGKVTFGEGQSRDWNPKRVKDKK